MARIVQASIFDLYSFNEEFILGYMNREAALKICEVINRHNPNMNYWYKVVDDSYRLHLGLEV